MPSNQTDPKKDPKKDSNELTEEQKKAELLRKQQEEQRAKEEASKDDQIADLKAANAGLEDKLATAEKEIEDLKARLAAAEKERDEHQGKLQRGKVATLDLAKGEAQLVESVTIKTGTRKVAARLGDVVILDGSPSAVDKAQKKLGEKHRAYSISKDRFDELVKKKLATAG